MEAFALARETDNRTIGEKANYLQLQGGLVIHYRNIVEMKIVEGKTLITIFPAYVNALTGEAVYAVINDEYLSSCNQNGWNQYMIYYMSNYWS